MQELLNDEEFMKLEKDFKFLRRLREIKVEKSDALDDLTYVIVDIETTGLEPTSSEIIEIGAIKLKGDQLQDKFEALISPQEKIPPHIEKITGISQAMVEGKPKIKDVLPQFLNFVQDAVLIAHNTEFDLSFIKHSLHKWSDKELNNKSICTVRLSRELIPGLANYKLDTIAQHLKISISNRHRAMGDAQVTLELWRRLKNMLQGKNILRLKELDKFSAAAAEMAPF